LHGCGAVAGFASILEVTIVRPQLTTVCKDVGKLGDVAVHLLLERFDAGELLPARRYLLNT
jgi:DNA-binding LacI/PurR family transcriptional regulator